MKQLISILVLAAAVADIAHAQAGPAPVSVPISTIMRRVPAVDGWISDLTGAPDGRLMFFTDETGVRVYDRGRKTTALVAKGNFDYVAASRAGDRLVLLRAAEDTPSPAAPNAPHFVWTIPVNPQTGAATGEPRRVSATPASAPKISPDGKSIAFITSVVPRKMVVVPVAGGVERVLFERGGPRGPVQWSPDGRWIYFVQPAQPPGPRTPNSPPPIRGSVMSRVSVDSGAPVPMTPPANDFVTGLSLDGRYVAALEQFTGVGITLAIFDTTSNLLGRALVKFRGEPGAFAWSGDGLHVLVAYGTANGHLHIQPVNGAAERSLTISDAFVRAPSLSPDGKHIAAVMETDSATLWSVGIMNADGTHRRLIKPIDMGDIEEPSWSPDGKYLAFRADAHHGVYIADAASGKATKVGSAEAVAIDFRWRDSRTLRYVRVDGTPTASKLSIHETTPAGDDRVVRDLTENIPTSGAMWYAVAWFVGDSAVLNIRTGQVIPLFGGEVKKLYEPRMNLSGGHAPAVAPDGSWIAHLSDDGKTIDVLRPDARGRHTIAIPGSGQLGRDPLFLADNRTLILATAEKPGAPVAIFAVSAEGGAPRRLAKLAPGEALNDLYVSPDGKSVIYVQLSSLEMVVADVDLGKALTPGPPGRK